MEKSVTSAAPVIHENTSPIQDDVKNDAASAESNDTENLNPERRKRDKNSRFAHEISYGLRQTATCFATDFLDPPISAWYQKRFGKAGQGGSIEHTVSGEVFGDTAAFFSYIALKRMFTGPIDGIVSGVKTLGSPILNKMGKNAIAGWAKKHDISEDDAIYKERLEDYKSFQAENAVDSSIISASAVGFNVMGQRHLFGNNQSYGTILKSKLLGAGLTLGVMGLTSVAFPTATKAFDSELEDRYVSKLIRGTKKAFGLKDEKHPTVISKTELGQTVSDDIPLSPEKREGLVIMVAEHAMKKDWNDPKVRTELLGKQKAVYEAFIKALDDKGPLVEAMVKHHYEILHKHHSTQFNKEADAAITDMETSRNSVKLSAGHKRRDMQQFIDLLDDKAFLEDVTAVIKSGKLPERHNTSISSDQKKYMSELLLKISGRASDVLDMAELQKTDYKALAHVLNPEGNATKILASELKKYLPDYDPKDIDGIAKDYAGYYQQEALSMAREFNDDSPVVKQALERSQSLRNKYAPPSVPMQAAMGA